MNEKKCFRCGVIQPLSEFYKHREMAYGHLNKCKTCTKADTQKRQEELNENNPEWVESEKVRQREKYHRLEYREKHKAAPYDKKIHMDKYKAEYPEKHKAKNAAQRIGVPAGCNRHNWSYQEPHYKDIIPMIPKDHYKAHRFLIYDQERYMYRRTDNNELLDTKEKHLEYITWCIENKED